MPGPWSRLGCFGPVVSLALDNGLGRRPPMGYNTWNDLGCKDMSEENVKAVADIMVSSGLKDAGYEYLNLDDCWMAPNRDADGKLIGDLDRFPSGMKALGDYIHGRGLKFGIYTDRGDQTCQNLPASLGNEAIDAKTFADWGVDYVKEDNCHSSTGANDKDVLFEQFGVMRDALNATGRPIFFSVCGGGDQLPWNKLDYYATDERGGAKLANAWRISPDVMEWETLQLAIDVNAGLAKYAQAGGFNDADMLLGTSKNSAKHMTQRHSRAQFNLWAIMASPLLIGANLRELADYDLATYTNKEIIAVNQDSLAKQGIRVREYKASAGLSWSIWARHLQDGSVAMVFFNTFPNSATLTCDASCWDQLPLKKQQKLSVRDLWLHAAAEQADAVAGESYSVKLDAGVASVILKFSPTEVLV